MDSPFDAPVAPPSFVPQINSLGNMIDTFAKRRLELQQQQEQAATAEENQKRLLARDANWEAYRRRKQDIAEKKVDADAAFKRAQATQLSLKEAYAAVAAGRHPGTMLVQGPDGNPVYVDWKFVPGQQAATPSAPPPAGGPPTSPTTAQAPAGGPPTSPTTAQAPAGGPPTSPTTAQAPMAAPDAPPQGGAQPPMGGPAVMNLPFALAQKRLPPLMSRAAPPSEPAPSPQAQAPDNSIFLDRNDEGTATALSGPEGQNRQELPIKAFPEGATEGQSFAPEDVNLKGGFGNPFAGPLPPSDNPEFGNGMLPNSTSQFVPGVDVRGMSTDAGQPQGGHWEARLPDGQVITFDPNEARAAKRDQDAQDLREIDVALADPETKLNPQMFQYYIGKKQALLGGLSPAEIKQIYAQKGAFDLQGARLASNEGMQDKRLASQEKIATEKIAAQKSIAELRRKKGRSGALVPPLAAGEGSAYQKLFTQDPFKAEKLATQVDAQIGRSLKNMNWDKLQGIGTNRLSIALRNLDLGTGTGQFDAMMGFFGYLRGGVPAKNETDEWKSMTSTAETFLNKIGRKLKLGNMGTLALNGGDLSPEQKQALSEQVTGMDPSQAKEMRAAIVESQKALQDFAENAAESVRAQYANRAPAEKELAEGKIAGLLQYAGKTRTNSAAGGKSTLDSKLDALNKALGL